MFLYSAIVKGFEASAGSDVLHRFTWPCCFLRGEHLFSNTVLYTKHKNTRWRMGRMVAPIYIFSSKKQICLRWKLETVAPRESLTTPRRTRRRRGAGTAGAADGPCGRSRSSNRASLPRLPLQGWQISLDPGAS